MVSYYYSETVSEPENTGGKTRIGRSAAGATGLK
jgi:hypothetical protein